MARMEKAKGMDDGLETAGKKCAMSSKSGIFNYIKGYIPYVLLAILFMCGEVLMDLLQPSMMSRIIDDGVLGLETGSGNLRVVLKWGALMICLVLAGGCLGSLNNVFVNLAAQNSGNRMRQDCFRRIMGFSFHGFESTGTGTLITRMTNDITQVQDMISQFIRGVVRTAALLGGSLFFMFRLNVHFGLVVTCALPFLLGGMALCIFRVNPLFAQLQERLDKLNEILQEDISGIRIIKACVRESYELVRFRKANGELIKTQLKILAVFAYLHPTMQVIMHTVTVLVLYLGFGLFRSGEATPGGIMAAISYTTQLLGGIMMLAMLFQSVTRGVTSWRRVKALLDMPPDMADGAVCESPFLQERHGSLEFRNVAFKYPGMEKGVLHDVNLAIAPGQMVAVMGATGCGKTSLVNLVPRFHDATSGQVLVDGVDVKEMNLEALRGRIAVALQKPELFNMSIRENIAWGNPQADDGRLREAASIAQALEFIEAMPEAFDANVAERGTRLSGGQKQRIALARALVKQSDILILDDATSALDLKTEADFYHALRTARPNLTVLVVAQRIASVRHADFIAILDGGTIADVGTHDELLARSKVYQEIYQSQMGGEEVAE